MAEAAVAPETPTLSEQYLLKGKEEKTDVVSKPAEVKETEKPETAVSEEVVQKVEETPAPASEEKTEGTLAAEEKTEDTLAAEESRETTATGESNSEEAPTGAEETNEPAEENPGEEEAAEEKPEIKLETAPADYRFPTTNQTRHCFTRYIEYHRCMAAKSEEGASECDKFARYYRSLCPSDWVERWNEQRENGTFPGPL